MAHVVECHVVSAHAEARYFANSIAIAAVKPTLRRIACQIALSITDKFRAAFFVVVAVVAVATVEIAIRIKTFPVTNSIPDQAIETLRVSITNATITPIQIATTSVTLGITQPVSHCLHTTGTTVPAVSLIHATHMIVALWVTHPIAIFEWGTHFFRWILLGWLIARFHVSNGIAVLPASLVLITTRLFLGHPIVVLPAHLFNSPTFQPNI
jgi:hypothetical protein